MMNKIEIKKQLIDSVIKEYNNKYNNEKDYKCRHNLNVNEILELIYNPISEILEDIYNKLNQGAKQ